MDENATNDDDRGRMDRNDDQYECVQPELGAEMWRLDDDATEAARRERLQRHLALCDACRIQRGIEARTGAWLREGRLRLPASARPWVRRVAWSGALATAAAVALLAVLPPRAADEGLRTRATGDLGFERPVEGEVLVGSRPTLQWTAIEGARSYDVSLRAVGGDFEWSGTSTQATLVVPAEVSLPRGAEIRARVRPVPRDLASAEGLGVMFRTGSWSDFAAHRLRHGARGAQLLGGLGVLLLVAALARRLF